MISKNSITKEWIGKVSEGNNNASKMLVEKVIRALLLLEGLVESDIDFVFKGGTALMLMLDSTKRLSIDIDIIVEQRQDHKKAFEKIVQEKGFADFELHERNAGSNIEKAHYKFSYNATHNTGKAKDNILLDILYEKPKYNNYLTIPIKSSFVDNKGIPIIVKVPDFNNILGDKLTAFAPETIGIPYIKNGNSKAMEIIKQLYDVGNIFDNFEDINLVKESFKAIVSAELKYRNLKDDCNLVIGDIINTSLTICTRGKDGTANFDVLNQGIKQIGEFIFSETYHIEKAITHASKAAYIAKLIEKDTTGFERYSDPLIMRDWLIEQPFSTRLNKLKKSNPEAFFYWYKTYSLTWD